MQITFTVPGAPIGKPRHRSFKDKAGNIRTYQPETAVNRENFIKMIALQYAPDVPLNGPLSLCVVFFVPIPASWSEKKKEMALCTKLYPAKKPDLDNMVKLVKDALNSIIWIDDKQIVGLNASKFYSDKPETQIMIQTI